MPLINIIKLLSWLLVMVVMVTLLASRDAIAKATYDRLFRWVVNQINRLLAPPINYVYQLNEIGNGLNSAHFSLLLLWLGRYFGYFWI